MGTRLNHCWTSVRVLSDLAPRHDGTVIVGERVDNKTEQKKPLEPLPIFLLLFRAPPQSCDWSSLPFGNHTLTQNQLKAGPRERNVPFPIHPSDELSHEPPQRSSLPGNPDFCVTNSSFVERNYKFYYLQARENSLVARQYI